MSTVKATHFEHPSASTPGITLGSDGSVVLPSGFTGGIGSNVVQVRKTNTFSTTSATFTLVTDMEATITPTSASSKVLVIVRALIGSSVQDGATTHTRVLRGATVIGADSNGNASSMATSSGARNGDDATIVILDSPATTSPTTYSLEARTANASWTAYVGRTGNSTGTSAPTSITLIEVAA